MKFDFATSNRIYFGCGEVKKTGEIAFQSGNKALLVTGRNHPDPEVVKQGLRQNGVSYIQYRVIGEPTVENIKEAVSVAREEEIDLVIGFGGGSVIDAGKAVAALVANPGDPLDYLEVVGQGKPLEKKPLPYIAIPTTAGTGSEVTRNAVLKVESESVKVSLRSYMMLPTAAIVDPELTYSLPPSITASVGMDALAQVLEPFVSVRANAMVDLFSQEGLARAGRSLKAAYDVGSEDSRVDMAWVSLLGGISLANGGLGAVHGFAAPLGGMFKAPHGAVCASLLPWVTEMNLKIMAEREPENPALYRYNKAAILVSGDEGATSEYLVLWLKSLCEDLSIPPLSDFGISPKDIPAVVEKASKSSSMKGNPISLEFQDMARIIQQAL